MKKVFFFLIVTTALSCSQKPDAVKIKTWKEGSSMPSFIMKKADTSQTFSSDSIKKGTRSVLIIFDPTCPYSKMETRRIIENRNELNDVQFILITSKRAISELPKFTKELKTEQFKNLTIAIDTGNAFIKYFNPRNVPFTVVYDKNKRLQHAYLGAMSKQKILKVIRI